MTLLSPPGRFKETIYRPDLVDLKSEYVLIFKVRGIVPSQDSSSTKKEYSSYVYGYTMVAAKRMRDDKTGQ